MQSTYSTQFPEQEHLKCPRCESSNTKFCYYNNYNLSQPRHFCKNCKRYWTKGGTLRNIPVGGGSRKNNKRPSKPKRSSSAQPKQEVPPSSTSTAVYNSSIPASSELNQERSVLLDMGGSFSSLLEGDGQFGNNVFDGLNSNGSPGLQFGENPMSSGLGSNLVGNPAVEFENSKNSERFPGIENDGDSSCWSSAINGWSDLAMYAPAGSSFQ